MTLRVFSEKVRTSLNLAFKGTVVATSSGRVQRLIPSGIVTVDY
jgi:hypothetical protein